MTIQLSKEEQLRGLLTGEWSAEARAVFRAAAHREMLTVKRGDIIAYARSNPVLTEAYVKQWEELRPAADIDVMWRENGAYKVAWMTWEGRPWAVKEFEDLNEAVAEHVCRQSGIRE